MAGLGHMYPSPGIDVHVADEKPHDVCVFSDGPYGHRAVFQYFTPPTLARRPSPAVSRPASPSTSPAVTARPPIDHQAIREASYVNIPVIAFCDTNAPPNLITVGFAWWLLARKVNKFFYRDPKEVEKQHQREAVARAAAVAGEQPEAPLNEWDVTSERTASRGSRRPSVQGYGRRSACSPTFDALHYEDTMLIKKLVNTILPRYLVLRCIEAVDIALKKIEGGPQERKGWRRA
ncbi:hypothetical protein OH77DRAFT_1526031 [Trametes cingulata]|nr:hypothetical protein OH77DRAFT_1526031 [Trametes cingulata]